MDFPGNADAFFRVFFLFNIDFTVSWFYNLHRTVTVMIN